MRITSRPSLGLEVNFRITDTEARALDALVGYGFEAFITKFKQSLGEHYMSGNEEGLRSFFESCRNELPGIIQRFEYATDVLEGRRDSIPRLPKEVA